MRHHAHGQDDQTQPLGLKPGLYVERGMVVEEAREETLGLEDQLAGKEHGVGKFARHLQSQPL